MRSRRGSYVALALLAAACMEVDAPLESDAGAAVPQPAEVCDGRDDDGDGVVDEGFDLLGDVDHCGACDRACPPLVGSACVEGVCLGLCPPGTADLDGDLANGCESISCPDPTPELCDGHDDDCDGRVDEDYDLDTDPQHCGLCHRACDLPGAVPACLDGVCAIERCAGDLVDADGDPENGCECEVVGDEICGGVDEDCDGALDEGLGCPY